MVPPIRLWDAGVPNRAALAIMTRNSRMPESLAADLDAECSACLMGARRLGELFERYGVGEVEACFDAILERTTETYRREILAKIPVGSWVWEDYAEHDGVDEPRLHTQRITLTRTAADDPGGERLVLDFDGTGPQARGPINHCGDYSDGVFLKKWLAPILRNLADTPERMAELDVNEGVVPLIEMRFPEPGTLLTPVFPAPTNARTFVILRLLGVLAGVLAKAVDGRMPADQETIRYTGRVRRRPRRAGPTSCARCSAVGRVAATTPTARTPSTSYPTRGTSRPSSPRRASRSGSRHSRWPSTAGEPGRFRGGLGYEKHIRMLRDAHFMSIADRSILSCWGVNGGRAGRPFEVTIDPGGPGEREVDALADAEPVRAGEVIRIRTTGGGGWGDPLEREPELVVRDVRVAQGLARGRAGRLRRRPDRLPRRRLPGSRPGRHRGRALGTDDRAARRSSTAAPGMPAWPAARRTPTSTCGPRPGTRPRASATAGGRDTGGRAGRLPRFRAAATTVCLCE